MRNLFRNAINWILPFTCILCKSKSDQQLDLRTDCERELPWLKQACTRCGIPLQIPEPLCGQCIQTPPPYDKTLALFHYTTPIDQLITSLKFHNKLIYAEILGKLFAKQLASTLRNDLPQYIIPIPLHQKRIRERGFNQALELARPIAKHLQIPIDLKHFKRTRSTESQSSLSSKTRQANIKNAFAIIKPLTANHVAIIDDVVTTSSTVTEFSNTLRTAGIKKIDVWCCARTGILAL